MFAQVLTSIAIFIKDEVYIFSPNTDKFIFLLELITISKNSENEGSCPNIRMLFFVFCFFIKFKI